MTIFLGGEFLAEGFIGSWVVMTKVRVCEQNYHFTHKNYNTVLFYMLKEEKLLPMSISWVTFWYLLAKVCFHEFIFSILRMGLKIIAQYSIETMPHIKLIIHSQLLSGEPYFTDKDWIFKEGQSVNE